MTIRGNNGDVCLRAYCVRYSPLLVLENLPVKTFKLSSARDMLHLCRPWYRTYMYGSCRRLVYTIVNDTRIPFSEIPTNDLDLTLCVDGQPYPRADDLLGYMHSFAMTENYIVLPETSYFLDPCTRFSKFTGIHCSLLQVQNYKQNHLRLRVCTCIREGWITAYSRYILHRHRPYII